MATHQKHKINRWGSPVVFCCSTETTNSSLHFWGVDKIVLPNYDCVTPYPQHSDRVRTMVPETRQQKRRISLFENFGGYRHAADFPLSLGDIPTFLSRFVISRVLNRSGSPLSFCQLSFETHSPIPESGMNWFITLLVSGYASLPGDKSLYSVPTLRVVLRVDKDDERTFWALSFPSFQV